MTDIRFKAITVVACACALLGASSAFTEPTWAAQRIGCADGRPVKVASLSFVPEKWNKQVNLQEADLWLANLKEADLRFADLSTAQRLETVTLTGAKTNLETKWPAGFQVPDTVEMVED